MKTYTRQNVFVLFLFFVVVFFFVLFFFVVVVVVVFLVFFFCFFFQINCCRFLFLGHNLSLFKNQRFLPKILFCEEWYFVETSGKT